MLNPKQGQIANDWNRPYNHVMHTKIASEIINIIHWFKRCSNHCLRETHGHAVV